ncbi:MarR family winged helix-turn-helix transcriptional regulator [Cellulomonas fengjieae]|uniref:MarR family winged helix-turn-helix transcriptional regulator n=1 Tax=Cellulomonas fengjieae TaxID=2819978 RepID=UPI0020C0654A|nr:MarR family transcriptional regulator [Cellulomonas fengjieae]
MNNEDRSGELLELLHGVLHGVRRDAAARLELSGTTPGQLRLLRTLERCDGPRRLGELAAALDVAPRSVTSKVDLAEEHGLVRRLPDPTDRRATLLELTDDGRRLLAAISAQRHEGVAERLGRLSEEDQAELLRLLRAVAD